MKPDHPRLHAINNLCKSGDRFETREPAEAVADELNEITRHFIALGKEQGRAERDKEINRAAERLEGFEAIPRPLNTEGHPHVGCWRVSEYHGEGVPFAGTFTEALEAVAESETPDAT